MPLTAHALPERRTAYIVRRLKDLETDIIEAMKSGERLDFKFEDGSSRPNRRFLLWVDSFEKFEKGGEDFIRVMSSGDPYLFKGL